VDPHDPSRGLESDLAADPSSAREPAQAPAGSLMSIQIRRRTPPRDRLPGPPAPKAARPETPSAPPVPAVAAPPPVAPEPEAPAPEKAAPAAPFPASDPGRRMQSIAPPPAAPSEPSPAEPADPPQAEPVAAPAPPARRAPLTAPGIARYARTGDDGQSAESKPQLAIPATPRASPGQRANTPPPPVARQESPAPAAEASRPEGIVSYWLRLRGSRRYPSKADLDQNRIIADWPNSILMRCRSGSKVLEPEKVFAGPGKASLADSTAPADTSQAAMELSPMMLQWLLTLAGDAAKDGRPMQDTEAFPSRNQSIRYGAFALPFSEDQSQIDHVLCHVYRAD